MSFLENILTQLRSSGIVRSQRGPEGGYWLARPAEEVNLAQVIRAVEGPLVGVRGQRPEEIEYVGSAETLQQVWIALRANLRNVLENVTVADVAARQAADGGARADARRGGLADALSGARPLAPANTRGGGQPHATRIWPSVELELLGLLARHLRPHLAAVVAAAARRAPRSRGARRAHERLGPVGVGVGEDLDVVRAHERVAEAVDGPDEGHHELVARALVELARRCRPARSGPGS